mmetsp:Transcript_25181/g.37050  ORF Transcript_25181/g.37050 Transcript_25181/m.37050 type:complete len:229 (+) Transcript_25181:461-1147(+)
MVSTTAMPSSSALWASMGPSMASPMAQIEGTDVRNVASVSIMPRVVLIPTVSNPMSSVAGRRPVDTRTTSATISSPSPPSAGSTVSFTWSPVTSDATTFLPRWNFMPCFLRVRWNALLISLSTTPPQISGMNSTTCTSAPRRRYTEPSSRPITPPPMTTIFSGTFFKDNAPVESTMSCFSLSTGTGGSSATTEPVATMMFFAWMLCAPPSFKLTSTPLGPAILPHPCT